MLYLTLETMYINNVFGLLFKVESFLYFSQSLVLKALERALSPLIDKHGGGKKLEPWFVTGLIEAEGTFNAIISLDHRCGKNITRIRARFALSMKNEDQLLVQVYEYFNCGNITKNNEGMTVYTVQDINSLHNIIIPHFEKYNLLGTKALDFALFKEVVNIIDQRLHLTPEGLKNAMLLAQQMNTKREKTGMFIEDWRKAEVSPIKLNGNYVNGFIAGDGSITILTNLDNKWSFGKIILSFTQHIDNYILMLSVLHYFSKNSNPTNHSTLAVGGQIAGTNNWDKLLAPHFQEFDMHGHKKGAIVKIFKIRPLLDNKHINRQLIIETWNDHNLSLYFENLNIQELKKPDIQGVNLKELQRNVLIALHKDKKTIYGTYTDIKSAVNEFGIDIKESIRENINKEYLVKIGDLLLYFVRNPYQSRLIKTKPILLTNTLTNEVKEFASKAELSKYLSPNNNSNMNLNKYMKPSVLYKNIYSIRFKSDNK